MKNIWRLLAALAIVGGLTACKKDKGPEGPTDFSGGCEAVDLGLSVKWASHNVGAFNDEGSGSFFAWGETIDKANYGWAYEGDYKWGIYDSEASPLYGLTKYTADVAGGDGLKKLQPGDDPATVNWGTKWRTPTIDEIKELLDETKCEWTWDATKKGYKIKGLATGNSIFLPAAGVHNKLEHWFLNGYGYYWSSSLNDSKTYCAYYFTFGIKDAKSYNDIIRCYGLSVRAVTEY